MTAHTVEKDGKICMSDEALFINPKHRAATAQQVWSREGNQAASDARKHRTPCGSGVLSPFVQS